jgi:hypothetical protein
MLTPENIYCIEWVEEMGGIRIPHTIIFNKTQISTEEVEDLIDSDGWEFDDRIIEVRSKQLKYLEDKM